METMMDIIKDDLGNLVIKFNDGEVLNFGGGKRPDGRKRPDVKAHKKVDLDLHCVTWYFANGATRTAKLDTYAGGIQASFALHGISQKLGDCYASSDDADAALAAWDELQEQLLGGAWEKPTRAGSGGSDGGLLAQAVAQVLGCSVKDAKEALDAMSAKERKAMEIEPDVAKAMDGLRKARAGGADVAGVRGKLEGLLKKRTADVPETDEEAPM
jgi:hypothetical protein